MFLYSALYGKCISCMYNVNIEYRNNGNFNTFLRSSNHQVRRHISSSLHLYGASSDVPLTRDRFPDLARGNYSQLTDEDIAFFDNLLEGRIITDQDELEGANTDWLRICKGESKGDDSMT